MSLTKSQNKELRERYLQNSRAIYRATLDSLIKEDSQQQEERVKHFLKPENYGEFFDYYFGMNTPTPMADSPSAWYHIDIYKQLYKQNFITLFNIVFRGGAKSTHANMGYPLAFKQNGKARFFLVVGINENRAFMLLQDLQMQLESNNRIIADFGKQKAFGSWSEGVFQTEDKCTFMALGLNQPFRGLKANGIRLGYVSIDDCEDIKTSLNQSLVNEYAQKITADIQGAFSIESERMIINNNFVTDTGLIANLMKRKGINPKHLNTKKNNTLTSNRTSIYIVNLTDKFYSEIQQGVDWQPSWKERYTKEACLRKIEDYSHDLAVLSGEFYNTPVKIGRLFKAEWIKWIKPLPLKDYDLLLGYWDFSYTVTGDTKAFALVGIKGNNITVLEVFCAHCDISDALEYHYLRAKERIKENDSCIYYYDASVAQEAVYTPILEKAAVKYKSFFIPIAEHSTTDKYIRVSATLTNAFRSGKLTFAEGIKDTAYWQEAELQLLGFERGSKLHDDFPDALEAAIRIATTNYAVDDSEDSFKPIIKKRKTGGY